MIIAFLGPPGAGKGTQIQILTEKLGGYRIDVGAKLRQIKHEKTPLAHLVRSLIDKGLSVPGDVLIQVVGPDIIKNKDKLIIIDDFLRQPEQVTAWFKFADKHNFKLDAVVLLDVVGQICWQRLLDRQRTQKRVDDKYDVFLTRYEKIYKTYIDEVLSMLSQRQVQILVVAGDRSIDEVTKNILAKLKPLLNNR